MEDSFDVAFNYFVAPALVLVRVKSGRARRGFLLLYLYLLPEDIFIVLRGTKKGIVCFSKENLQALTTCFTRLIRLAFVSTNNSSYNTSNHLFRSNFLNSIKIFFLPHPLGLSFYSSRNYFLVVIVYFEENGPLRSRLRIDSEK